MAANPIAVALHWLAFILAVPMVAVIGVILVAWMLGYLDQDPPGGASLGTEETEMERVERPGRLVVALKEYLEGRVASWTARQ